jgi:putative DNA primase/helicase
MINELTSSAIPLELRQLRQWVTWRWERRKNKRTKVPINPNDGSFGNVSNASTWGTFDKAIERCKGHDVAGLGFVFTDGDPYVGVDLDSCVDLRSGAIEPWADTIIKRFVTYSERSPSGTGVKLFCRGQLPTKKTGTRRPFETGAVEMYQRGRFFTVTGQSWNDAQPIINDCQPQIDELWAKLRSEYERARAHRDHNGRHLPADDDAILRKALNSNSGAKFSNLWSGNINGFHSHSEADLSLCSQLAFWCGPDANRIDGLFRRSGLMRDKWEREDYRTDTIQKAIDGCTQFYNWDLDATGVNRKATRISASVDNGRPPSDVNGLLPDAVNFTDVGNGKRLAREHRGDIRYCHPWKKWLVWDKTHWSFDETGEISRRAKQTISRMLSDAAQCEDRAKRAALVQHAIESENITRLNAMIKAAESEPGLPVLPSQLDKDIWLFNTRSGTVDLRTGLIRPHSRDDLITRVAPVQYHTEPGHDCPNWDGFLKQILTDSPELIGFVRRLLGHCLSGDVSEQILPIFYGVGANGKSTLLNLMLFIMGEYAMKAPPDLLMVKHNDSHPTERADLFGRRFVVANETEDGRRLAEALVKDLSGGDRVRARRMREDFWEFVPTHKIVLATNHRPIIRGTEHAIWRRIRLVPFTVIISDEEQDKRLLEKLQAEAPAILRWLITGCLEWQRIGLGLPDDVRAATDEYRRAEDLFGSFVAECCVVGDHVHVSSTELLDAYKSYSGDKSVTSRRLRQQLIDHGLHSARITAGDHKGRMGWFGLGLRRESEASEPSEADSY